MYTFTRMYTMYTRIDNLIDNSFVSPQCTLIKTILQNLIMNKNQSKVNLDYKVWTKEKSFENKKIKITTHNNYNYKSMDKSLYRNV